MSQLDKKRKRELSSSTATVDTDRGEDDDPARAIEHLKRYLQDTYKNAPTFFVSTLEQAVNEALHLDAIENRRPLLIYLHKDKNKFNQRFCSEIFCREELINYLLANYIVWPWDITSEANKNRLKIWWRNVFPDIPDLDLRGKHYPMLVGIMLCALREEACCPESEYERKILQHCNFMPQTDTRSATENVVEILSAFRQESLRNRQFLVPFDFVRSTSLCMDVVIEITKYLSLVDTINAFSIGILPRLHQARAKIQLVNPSTSLLKMVREQLDPRQIAALPIADDFPIQQHDLQALQPFDRLISVTLISEQEANVIDHLRPFLPNVDRLSIWFKNERNLDHFSLLDLSSPQITRLEIRCPAYASIDFWADNQQEHHVKNTTITSFVLDMEYYPRHQGTSRRYHYSSHLVNSTLEFIRTLVNIRRVRFVTNRHNIKTVLQLNQWQQLIAECLSLERVIIQLVGNRDFTQEVANVEQELRQLRPSIVFRIKIA